MFNFSLYDATKHGVHHHNDFSAPQYTCNQTIHKDDPDESSMTLSPPIQRDVPDEHTPYVEMLLKHAALAYHFDKNNGPILNNGNLTVSETLDPFTIVGIDKWHIYI